VSPFELSSAKAAAAFLQTVVIVDDKAEFTKDQDTFTDLAAPDEFGSETADAPAGSIVIADTERSLDAGAVSSAFAGRGLICSVLKPLESDNLKDAIIKSAVRSDILVLDWQMFNDGDTAMEITKTLADLDDATGGRLRLIAVYTSESPLSAVAAKIQAKYPTLIRDGSTLAFHKASTRIILLAKDASPNAVDEDKYAVSATELPDRLIKEFAWFAEGLLPNATMAAIAGIRDNTHRILARFDKSLDGPMLTHRVLIPSAEDAEGYVSELILGEISAQMPIHSAVSAHAGREKIEEYLAHRRSQGLSPRLMMDENGNTHRDLTDAELLNIIEQGRKGLPGNVQISDKNFPHRLYLLFSGDISKAKADHISFSVRSKLKRDASSVKQENELTWPKLKLGSLLKYDKKFWICLTPICDSARIPITGGSFLFAELTINKENKSDFVIPDGKSFQHLELARQRTSVISKVFRPAVDLKEVTATVENGVAKFYPVGASGKVNKKTCFLWLGELKPLQAQRFSQIYASNLARVGLDDFEWHRSQAANQ